MNRIINSIIMLLFAGVAMAGGEFNESVTVGAAQIMSNGDVKSDKALWLEAKTQDDFAFFSASYMGQGDWDEVTTITTVTPQSPSWCYDNASYSCLPDLVETTTVKEKQDWWAAGFWFGIHHAFPSVSDVDLSAAFGFQYVDYDIDHEVAPAFRVGANIPITGNWSAGINAMKIMADDIDDIEAVTAAVTYTF